MEKVSGKDVAGRKQLQAMLEYIREDDVVYVAEFSRLGRSTTDLLSIVQKIEDVGAKFVSLKEQFDTSTAVGRLQLTILSALSQFERELTRERMLEGIAIAKREGKYKGRKKVVVPDIGERYAAYMSRKTTKAEMARELGISRTTLDKVIKEYLEGKADVE